MATQSDYETDTESQPRRTSRTITPVRLGSGMIRTSQDSRRGLSQPSSQVPSTSHKRGRSVSASGYQSRNEVEIIGGTIVPNQTVKSKKQKKKQVSTRLVYLTFN